MVYAIVKDEEKNELYIDLAPGNPCLRVPSGPPGLGTGPDSGFVAQDALVQFDMDPETSMIVGIRIAFNKLFDYSPYMIPVVKQ